MSEDMKREMSAIKNDVGVLKSDVGVLKSDVGVLKSDVGALKNDAANLTTLARNTSMLLARLVGDVSDMKHGIIATMATKSDISMLMKRMDGFADMLQDSRWDWGKQKVRLDEHEKRITSLEAKRA